jgi:hypothetical protein
MVTWCAPDGTMTVTIAPLAMAPPWRASGHRCKVRRKVVGRACQDDPHMDGASRR